MRALRFLPLVLFAGCSIVGGWQMPWARDCADRPTELGAHLSCGFDGRFRILESERHPCAKGGGLLGDGRALHIRDEYRLEIVQKGSDELFARIKLEQSVPERYSQHKWGLMESLHTMSPAGVPGAEVNGIATFWIDETVHQQGDVETIRVVFDERAHAIATIQFLRTSAGVQPRALQDEFVAAYTRCLSRSASR